MNTIKIPAIEARRQFGELLDRVHYQDNQYRITRNHKPIAWLVGDTFMQNVGQVIDQIIENDSALADTFALTIDSELNELINKGTEEKNAGNTVPLESILDD